jgi:hypothetical protein
VGSNPTLPVYERIQKTRIKLKQYSSDGEYCLIITEEIVDKFMCNEHADIVVSA